MNENTKIQFSTAELTLLQDKEFILTKRAIAKKVIGFLENLQHHISEYVNDEHIHLPELLKHVIPKITRGENYKGFPYFVLDHPACFNKEEILAIRTIIIWGDCISVQLLCTQNLEDLFERILRNLNYADPDVYVCINNSPWLHEFSNENYIKLKEFKGDFTASSFVKVAYKFNLTLLQGQEDKLIEGIKKLLEMLRK